MHSFSADTDKILQLMVSAIYKDRDIFLRELVSNAADACERARYLAVANSGIEVEAPSIVITVSADGKMLTIADTGAGMSEADLHEQLGSIASSGTSAFTAKVGAAGNINQIGQFGVGFYSAFMAADQVVVYSRKLGDPQCHHWQSNGKDGYSVEKASSDKVSGQHGTTICLSLKQDAEAYADRYRLEHIIRTYMQHINVPIRLIITAKDDTESEYQATFAGQEPLWRKLPASANETEYQSFYQQLAHTKDTPFLQLHQHLEGRQDIRLLLFVPQRSPLDLFSADTHSRVKLYVKCVFIADSDVDILPRWLRFVQGIVDCDDLPLTIGRDNLQSSAKLGHIQRTVSKRVLAKLKHSISEDRSRYAETFWSNFGDVLKEGLCESDAPRDAIFDCCLFAQSADEGLISFNDYVASMADNQQSIYYLLGDSIDELRKHPQLDGLHAAGINVLLLASRVDDFWVTVVNDYQGKPLRNLAHSSGELASIEPNKADDAIDSIPEDQQSELLDRLKLLFGDLVASVEFNHRLKQSPSSLSQREGAMHGRMEQFLREQKQLPDSVHPKILQLSSSHALIQKLSTTVDEETFNTLAWLLLDQAKLVEGEPLTDKHRFIETINSFAA